MALLGVEADPVEAGRLSVVAVLCVPAGMLVGGAASRGGLHHRTAALMGRAVRPDWGGTRLSEGLAVGDVKGIDFSLLLFCDEQAACDGVIGGSGAGDG